MVHGVSLEVGCRVCLIATDPDGVATAYGNSAQAMFRMARKILARTAVSQPASRPPILERSQGIKV
jgi:hypothetical protein